MTRVSSLVWRFAAVLLLALTGCRSYPPSAFPEECSVPPPATSLLAGDEVEINFMGAPDMNSTQAIRRDGTITLKLIGEVEAAGKTPKQLRQELMSKYESQLQVREVSVLLRTPAPVYVSGAVYRPGAVEMRNPMTALEAIQYAGGFRPYEAEVRSVIVMRHDGEAYRGYSLNFKPLLDKGTEEPVFYLHPFDIVYVPRTLIVRVNQVVEQYITRNIPVVGSAGASYADPSSYVVPAP